MKNIKKIYGLHLLLSLLICSCSKWLDVKPEDRITEEAVFNAENNVSDALTGVYAQMADNTLYGKNLTLTILDLFAQNYWCTNTTYPWYQFAAINQSDATVSQNLQAVWGNMYIAVANVNNFIENIDKARNIAPERIKYYKGQALALRAFLYFDLLRMWGPRYSTADSVKNSIPVYNKVSVDVSDFIPATKVMDTICRDISQAEELLAADPVATEGYRGYNNLRMNLFSVKALKARVFLYRNNKPAAFAAAKEVIAANNPKLFPWVNPDNIKLNQDSTDKVFATEVLFGIYNRQLYSNQVALYDENLLDFRILAGGRITAPATQNFTDKIFESKLEDFRYSILWQLSSPLGYRTFRRYEDVKLTSYTMRYVQPLIRLSEVYYIAAEADPDPVDGLNYLNTVIAARGITTKITDPTKLEAEILKEYRKEFIGEGQLWFYYKRKNITQLPTPNAANGTLNVDAGRFVFAYPDSEMSSR
ncbi:RagB/SusD family nutrient uptake outer membrane protein [Chitinophaga sp. sic0106]|uniref:RagB/SusD family nutrient uptake outer membrane protein n=1 Tax=Chitinophaga sp. sic0106 TaxID=2854785 RepID=UPI001C460676|nr:RagB/SusD family nutrient uptake outer membrane protein [Chitinophaga sp. sic0106]MBV7529173.1 RagB/SusD family nutrient uptake outer membrane protein [Chitinophaga sp. sic0106]